ncbi:Hypothetical protein PHPALM_11519 [Phytophthora palmivora]|uniref:SWIM-type domain-containing protein n=1 Tax=Phytophthora palmivora TaxID=4796 RepID=A0A2P4Y215_9STRA|nr:Hypothetical protein PHPALM_11519 [Phytophthora palmivora]
MPNLSDPLHHKYAQWLDNGYLTDPWDLWFYTASGCPGVVPNQNPIEAHHRAIKSTAVNHLRAATGYVLASTLPKPLVECAMSRCATFCCIALRFESASRMRMTGTTILKKFRRDCKAFYHTGWVCEHVLACLHLVGDLNLEVMLHELPAREPPGRPWKKKQCLVRDGVRQYSVDALIRRLVDNLPVSSMGVCWW